jgi:hypothetical protein
VLGPIAYCSTFMAGDICKIKNFICAGVQYRNMLCQAGKRIPDG